jgi:polysaccharide export outer membrane protein
MLLPLAALMLALSGCRSVDNSVQLDSDPAAGKAIYSTNQIHGEANINSPGDVGQSGIYSTNQLHDGDVVGIAFQYATNFDTVQKIGLDGTFNLDMVGRVIAAGRTVMQLQQDITKDYQPFAKGDVITVKLITSTACIYVAGSVLRPGAVELDHPMTVLEAIMDAGGFDNSRANLSKVTVLRIEDGSQQTYRVNLNKVLDGRDPVPFYVRPFDIVYVPAKVFNY